MRRAAYPGPMNGKRLVPNGIHRFVLSLLVLGLTPTSGCAPSDTRQQAPPWRLEPVLTAQISGVEARLIGISAVDENIAWISGTEGTYARTTDGGTTWHAGVVPEAGALQFRDVHAVDAETAYLLSIGEGEQSRIYKTTDAGSTWALQFTNPEPEGFFDCMDFWDEDHGIAFSDSFGGAFFLITTADGGATWERAPADRLPPASEGEGSFAASGTCLVTHGEGTAWVGTGAGASARVLKTTDRGRSWTVADTPIVGGTPTAGIASLAFRDADHGAALGGVIDKPDEYSDNVAVTHDGGSTWTLAGRPSFPGAVYGAAYVPGAPTPTLVAVGPNGMAYSADNGMTWTNLDTLSHWSVALASLRSGWAIGPEGRVTHIRLFE